LQSLISIIDGLQYIITYIEVLVYILLNIVYLQQVLTGSDCMWDSADNYGDSTSLLDKDIE